MLRPLSMSTPSRLLAALLILAATISIGVVQAQQPAEASHFRSTQLTWTQAGPTTVEFKSTVAARRSFFGSPNVGDTTAITTVFFGDGNFASPPHTVVAVDTTNDWLLAEATFTHTYASPGPFTAFADTCCRLSPPQHINNPDDNNRAETIVDLSQTSASPVSSISPIVDCALNALCQFTVPAVDPDGQGLRFRFATSIEATGGASFEQPGPPHASNAATVDPTTGLYSWNTTGATLNSSGDTFYSTQVMVENVVDGAVVSKTPVDFFIRLTSSPNQAPTFITPTPTDGTVINTSVGSPVTFDVAATDPDTGDTVTLGMLGKPATASFTSTAGNPGNGTFTWTPTVTGSVILTLTAQDQHGLGATQRSVTINVTGATTDAGPNVTGNEGAAILLDGDVTGASTSTWTYSAGADVDPGTTCAFADGSAADTTITCTDNGTFTATLAAGASSDTTTVTVTNVAPSITSISAPTDPVALSTTVPVTAAFTDPGSNDTHTCTIDWGDGTITAGSVTGGSCSSGKNYTVPGIYTLTATVTDDDSGQDTELFQYVVVYDPSAGFVTGGGWIDSPAGAYTADPDLSGKANFGFVSRYKKGANVPDGNTQFQFHAAGLNFHSTVYEWLVVAGSKGQFKGSGTINGAGDYGFMLTATDGQQTGGGGIDRFRMKIWDKTTGTVIYDNQIGASDGDAPSDAIEGGSIVIHSGKK